MTIAELSSPVKALAERGTIVETLQYIPPEVLQGAEADRRNDLFSFGCVLCEMVTGRRASWRSTWTARAALPGSGFLPVSGDCGSAAGG